MFIAERLTHKQFQWHKTIKWREERKEGKKEENQRGRIGMKGNMQERGKS